MKKIFYSLMAVALCSCAQSDVEDAGIPTPQPENNGVKFTVVDNGFVGEDGTRVTYGAGGNDYAATFDNGDEIGVYAIKSADMAADGTPNAYVVENAKLTLTNGIWKGSIDFKDADLLFAYSPYRENVNLGDGKPLFTGEQGSWAISTGDNRFFVWDYLNQDNGTKEKFEAADWMGAAANITSGQTEITFNMIHMRGMVELTTPKEVELTDLTLAINGDNGAQYHFTPYFFNENDANRTQNIYRILTTEYRDRPNTVYATIKDGAIVKKFKKTLNDQTVGAGICAQVKLAYELAPVYDSENNNGQTLAKYLAANPDITTLRLKGNLTNQEDWNVLKNNTTLTTLDMSELENTELPDPWLDNIDTYMPQLTKLYLPNKLTKISHNSLQVKNVANIDVPASVTTIGDGAFWNCPNLSVRIPEDSKLQTVGNGVFYNLKAVYTYENNKNLLVLPASLTSIGQDGAFYSIEQLKKVVFTKGEQVPTINNAGKEAFKDTNAIINVPQKDGYAGQFPGHTVYINALPLTADNYSSPHTHKGTDGLGLPALCDGIIGVMGNHWHSDWSASTHDYDQWGIYIDIKLPEDKEYSNLKVFYTTRGDGNNFYPKRVAIGVSDNGTDYTEVFRVESGLPTGDYQTKALDSAIAKNDNTSYKYVRFAFLETGNSGVAENTTGSKALANLAELMLAEDAWTE